MLRTQERILERIRPEVSSLSQFKVIREAVSSENKNYNNLDTIVILGSSMDFNRFTRRWQFKTIVHNGIGLVDGGSIKAMAAKRLIDEGYLGTFLVTGGEEQDRFGHAASRADELTKEMTKGRRIPKEQVINIGGESSTNTHGNVEDVIEFLAKHDNLLSHKKIGVLANEWQIFRALLIFNEYPFFKERGIELVPIISKEVLLQGSRRYNRFFEKIDSLPQMEQRITLEASGIEDLLTGRYKSRH